MKTKEWYEKNWRRLEKDEMPIVGDAWFPGGFCSCLSPKILDNTDCLDPVGMQDSGVFRKKTIKRRSVWNYETQSEIVVHQ